MCKKLKLTNEQAGKVEQEKDAQREVSEKNLEERKNPPEYQVRRLQLILKKPWVESANDDCEKSGSIVVTLKKNYEFKDRSGFDVNNFDTVYLDHAGTVKGPVNQLNEII